MRKILVTGGAGFIGSHTVDLLLERGYRVRVLDNLEQPTHAGGVPRHVPPQAEFIYGDVRRIDDVARALHGVDGVIHLAATGGFTPELSRYFQTNSIGTAHLLELVAERRHRLKKVVVASSVAIYGEGSYRCAACGPQAGAVRAVEQLERGEWEPKCPQCGAALESVPTPETKTPSPENAYAISKYDEERLVLSFGRQFDIDTCALRYFLTYGPRQSLTNPYTGVIAIFSSLLLAGRRPVLFEDGRQRRDFVFVQDVARANVLALESEGSRGEVFNVGTGVSTSIGDVAKTLAELLNLPELTAEFPDEFRPNESRHVVADIEKIRQLGFSPQVDLRTGLARYLDWVRGEADVRDYFSEVLPGLRQSGVVRSRATATPAAATPDPDSLTIVIPAFNEAGNLESIVRYALDEVAELVDDFEILIVNDGSHDGTGVIADDLAAAHPRVRVIHHPFNVGYGGAQKTGFRYAQKNWVVLVPADHQFDVKHLALFLDARREADIIASVRIDRADPWPRRVVSRVYNWYVRNHLHLQVSDLNWVKMIRREALSQINIETAGFAVDAEIVVKAQALGYRVTEVRVPHHPRTWGHPTGIRIRTIWRTMRELLRIERAARRATTAEKVSHALGKPGPAP
ncbi:MAG: NAD-dependent epimerase/dehydratase family protein [Pirellulales bacterium]|nr:NAD-dependent epimerase/dehydratase family protein [Pirellulales bacterium]